jgi:hypothetical protein
LAYEHSEGWGRRLDEDRHLRRFRTGKTTFVGAVSNIMPLRTEALRKAFGAAVIGWRQ